MNPPRMGQGEWNKRIVMSCLLCHGDRSYLVKTGDREKYRQINTDDELPYDTASLQENDGETDHQEPALTRTHVSDAVKPLLPHRLMQRHL